MKKSTKKLVTLACSILGGLSLASIPLTGQAVTAQEYAFVQGEQLQANVKKGDTITIPEGRFGSVEAQHYVYCPNGEVYATDTLTLSQHGEHTLKYVAEIAGKVYVEEQTFEVGNPLTYFVDATEASTAEYGYSDVTRRTGLKVALENGAEFVYNEVVDLSKTSQLDPALWLTYIPIPGVGFGADTIHITLTDIYDPSNTVEIRIRHGSSQSDPFGSIHARAPGQLWAGYAYGSWPKRVYINNAIGAPFRSCPFETALNGDYQDIYARQYYKIWFDLEQNKLYGTYGKLNEMDVDAVVSGEVIDFDEASYQSVIWDGFTTGEVYISFKCDTYNQATNDLQILSVNGSDITATTVNETKATIAVDTEGYDVDELPDGKVGYSYPVFGALAYDRNCGGLGKVTARAFYGYSKLSGEYQDGIGEFIKEIPIVNGRFETPYAGYYAISYTYKSYTGQIFERVVGVNVTEGTVALDEIVVADGTTTAEPYERVRLADVLSYGGGVGNVRLTRTVRFGEEKIEITESKVNGFSFQPKQAGDYEVSYTATDLVGNTAEYSYTVQVSEQSAPVFTRNPELPRYFFAGVNYVLPTLNAMDANQNKEVEAKVKIIDGAGEREYTQGSAATFTANSDGVAVIRYYLDGREAEYTVPVLTVKETLDDGKIELALQNYFVPTSNVQVAVEPKGTKLMASGNGSVEFARELLAQDVSLVIAIGSLGETFNGLNITFTDSYDSTIAVELNTLYANGTLFYGLNGEILGNYSDLLQADAQETVKYDLAEKAIRLGADKFMRVKETVNGEPFNGFTSGKIYVRFSFVDVKAESYVYLYNVNNQAMSVTRDSIAPMIYMDGKYEDTTGTIGDKFTLVGAQVHDVLGPVTKLTVSVSWNGMYVRSTAGVLLGDVEWTDGTTYEFELADYGDYIITYLATDWSGRTYKKEYMIKSVDLQAPVISLENMPEKIELGTVKLPKATATDNVTNAKNIQIYVIVRTPSEKLVGLDKNNRFTVTEKGTYTITYYAIDEIGNIAKEVYAYTV